MNWKFFYKEIYNKKLPKSLFYLKLQSYQAYRECSLKCDNNLSPERVYNILHKGGLIVEENDDVVFTDKGYAYLLYCKSSTDHKGLSDDVKANNYIISYKERRKMELDKIYPVYEDLKSETFKELVSSVLKHDLYNKLSERDYEMVLNFCNWIMNKPRMSLKDVKKGTFWHLLVTSETAGEYIAILLEMINDLNEQSKNLKLDALRRYISFLCVDAETNEINNKNVDCVIYSLRDYYHIIRITESGDIQLTDRGIMFIGYVRDKDFQAKLYNSYNDI